MHRLRRQNSVLAEHARGTTLDWDRLKAEGWQRLNVPEQYAPFAQGNFPTASGKCEFYSEALARPGLDPLEAKRVHLELFVRYLEHDRGNIPHSVAHHLTPLVGYYRFALIDG